MPLIWHHTMMLNCQRFVLINLWTMYHKYYQKMYGRDNKDQWHKAAQEFKETGKEKSMNQRC